MRDTVGDIGAYAARMRRYFREMFPLAPHLAVAALAGVGIAGFLRALQGNAATASAQAILSPAWNVFAMLLILRLMDELKDREIDRRLFPERPLPSGRVREADIRGTLACALVLYLATNAYAVPVLLAAMLVLGYAGLMFRRFFARELLERSLPITLATHTPILPLMLLQAIVASADRLAVRWGDVRYGLIVPYVAMIWVSILGWELARKIRAPAEETAYVTYSQIFGLRGAVAAAALTQGLALAFAAHLLVQLELGAAYLAVPAAAWCLNVYAYLRFLRRPDPTTSRLKPYAAIFVFAVLLAQAGAFGGLP